MDDDDIMRRMSLELRADYVEAMRVGIGVIARRNDAMIASMNRMIAGVRREREEQRRRMGLPPIGFTPRQSTNSTRRTIGIRADSRRRDPDN